MNVHKWSEEKLILSTTSQPSLLSFTLDGWIALGGQVSVSLVDRVGVLVGRNGAGKSAILEGLEAISLFATRGFPRHPFDSDGIPKILDIEVLTPTERFLKYRYELILLPVSAEDSDIGDSTSDNSEESQYSWNDRCEYIDGDRECIWTTENGVTNLINSDAKSIINVGIANLLRQSNRSEELRQILPQEMRWVYSVLGGIRFLEKAQIRQTSRRRPILIKVSGKKIVYTSNFGRADNLAHKIFRRIDKGELDELENVCQRIGLGSKISVQKFVLNEESSGKIKSEDEEYLCSVLLDGVNIGLLSDGTLRVLSILIEIIPSSSESTTIIIEEPETQIHPGMLEKLLKEIEAYTFEENLILSTHSPQVVAWTSPKKINLVYRNDGRTSVRKLNEKEIQKVTDYLYEEGDLGDWLYSGILDE